MTTKKAKNQVEVDLLPPFGKDEVHIEGAVGTVIVASAVAAAILGRFTK